MYYKNQKILVGAGVNCIKLSRESASRSMEGLEFFSGIPGTVGGAIRMNAGAFGSEMSEVLTQAKAVNRKGEILTFERDEMDFDYRHNGCPNDLIFISAIVSGRSEDPVLIAKRMLEVNSERNVSQPIKARTGGSTFKNPIKQTDEKVWKLIKKSVPLDTKFGDAEISNKHCNFFVNKNNATFKDMKNLIEFVKKNVKLKTGINIETEIEIIQ